MQIIDSNSFTGDSIFADVCIIGAGPAGITLANRLSDTNLNVIIADSGGTSSEETPNTLNCMKIESNFIYRHGVSVRNRQIGGTANLWAGRVVPFVFNPTFDKEWGRLKESVKSYYNQAFRMFNINPDIQNLHEYFDNELYAYWANKTEMFDHRSQLISKQKNSKIYKYLTFIGEAELTENQITAFTFVNQNHERISIHSHNFVFAMGAVENSRMLLVMKDQLESKMGDSFRNVGKYIMDHPKISHGTVDQISKTDQVIMKRYQIKSSGFGMYKVGIRNEPLRTRVYCNLIGNFKKYIKMNVVPFQSFQTTKNRLIWREIGLLRTVLAECNKLPLIEKSSRFKKFLNLLVNSKNNRNYRIITYCEQQPRSENKIVLDDEKVRNHHSIPKVINSIHQDELEEVRVFYHKLKSQSEIYGFKLTYDPELVTFQGNYTDSSHIIGGTRYSSEKAKAVVDEELRVIGITNLYITGSSVFPTAGVENPTHLIVSVSCYLADVLKKKFNLTC